MRWPCDTWQCTAIYCTGAKVLGSQTHYACGMKHVRQHKLWWRQPQCVLRRCALKALVAPGVRVHYPRLTATRVVAEVQAASPGLSTKQSSPWITNKGCSAILQSSYLGSKTAYSCGPAPPASLPHSKRTCRGGSAPCTYDPAGFWKRLQAVAVELHWQE